PHHDVCEEDALLAGRTDGRNTAVSLQRRDGGGDVAAPEMSGRQDLDPIRPNRQGHGFGAFAGDEERIQPGCLEPPGKTATGRAVVDRTGQRGARYHGQAGGGGGGSAAQRSDCEDQRHGRIEGIEAEMVAHQAHPQTSAPRYSSSHGRGISSRRELAVVRSTLSILPVQAYDIYAIFSVSSSIQDRAGATVGNPMVLVR